VTRDLCGEIAVACAVQKSMPAVQAKESTAKEIKKRRIAAPRKTVHGGGAPLSKAYVTNCHSIYLRSLFAAYVEGVAEQ
jgi:hypothetical protein